MTEVMNNFFLLSQIDYIVKSILFDLYGILDQINVVYTL